MLDANHPRLVGREGDNLLDSWIFSGGSDCVRHVIAGGRHVVREGRHIAEEQIARNFAAAIARLKEAA